MRCRSSMIFGTSVGHSGQGEITSLPSLSHILVHVRPLTPSCSSFSFIWRSSLSGFFLPTIFICDSVKSDSILATAALVVTLSRYWTVILRRGLSLIQQRFHIKWLRRVYHNSKPCSLPLPRNPWTSRNLHRWLLVACRYRHILECGYYSHATLPTDMEARLNLASRSAVIFLQVRHYEDRVQHNHDLQELSCFFFHQLQVLFIFATCSFSCFLVMYSQVSTINAATFIVSLPSNVWPPM